MPRVRLVTTAFMSITDHETFGSNETGTASRRRSVIMTDDQPTTPIMRMSKGVGGEVRVEADLSGDVLSNGDVRVTGEVKLFEGTSEQTTDLDGRRSFDVTVPLNRGASHVVRIRNDDEGGDFAVVILAFRTVELVEQPSANTRRRITVGANLRVVDHETFGSNEESRAQATRSAVLGPGQPASLMEFSDGAGGEVRVEVSADAEVQDDGDVVISGLVQLFEGTSEQTTDLDGTRRFNFTIPRDQNSSQTVTVRNTDEGGDFAVVRLNVSNVAA